jgi:hypothetical protein
MKRERYCDHAVVPAEFGVIAEREGQAIPREHRKAFGCNVLGDCSDGAIDWYK